jgi:uncharacterized membrane protein (DUF4010 family)
MRCYIISNFQDILGQCMLREVQLICLLIHVFGISAYIHCRLTRTNREVVCHFDDSCYQ